MPGSAAWREDHASLDIARAFALCADVTGDDAFLRDKAWPCAVGRSRMGQEPGHQAARNEIRASMGIAERKSPSDNAVFTNISARTILLDAISSAKRLNRQVDPAWLEMRDPRVVPKRGKVVISHDAFRVDEEKAATPDPLMGIFPLGCGFDNETEQATLAYYLKIAKRYIGSPMLSALYHVGPRVAAIGGFPWRCWTEAMVISAPADLCKRWNTATYFQSNRQPDQILANLGGFLLGLILGTFQRYNLGLTILKTGARAP